jgi:UrcA family protein
MMMKKIGLVAFAAFALATSASAATTENPFAQDKAVLQLGGLDLSTPDGQQRLAIRMDQAARSVCGERLSTVHLDAEAKSRECRAAVVADVRNQIEARTAKADTKTSTQFAMAN